MSEVYGKNSQPKGKQPESDVNSKVARQLRNLLGQLVDLKAIPMELANSIVEPTTSADIVPRLLEIGVDDRMLAEVLAQNFKLEVFDGDVDNMEDLIRSSNDPCPWLIADHTLYVTNPYDREQIEPLMRRNKSPRDAIKFERLGILAISDFDSHSVSVANFDVETSSIALTQGGAWAKEFNDELLNEAILRKASDIHINPEPHGGVVRLRIDGRCEFSRSSSLQNISKERYKLVANNLMERVGKQNNYLEPSSGFLTFQAAHRQVSMRLEMAPVKVNTDTQPKITLRILNNQRNLARIEQLGLSEQQIDILRSVTRRSNGLIIVTGPTGSGKSTTLKTMLRDIRDYYPEKALFTIEDPVEDPIEGITSMEITKHMGFAKALKSLLRHDPDVIMVGEIRDSETAELALRASMTGHLVLTTLHTNDAHSAISRLRDLGLEDSLLAENLLVVTAQRLVNKVCPHCCKKMPISSDKLLWQNYQHVKALAHEAIRVPIVNRKGCDQCNWGFVGRHLVNELFVNDPESQRMIDMGVTANQIRAHQYQKGRFKDLWDDGIRLVKDGVTTLEALESKINPLHVARANLRMHLQQDSGVNQNNSNTNSHPMQKKNVTNLLDNN